MGAHRRLQRSDLFLVRIWTEIADITEAHNAAVCRGRVQRVIDGESRPFDNWQSLLDVLRAMMSVEGNPPQEPTLASEE